MIDWYGLHPGHRHADLAVFRACDACFKAHRTGCGYCDWCADRGTKGPRR